MASVIVYTTEKMDELLDEGVVGATISSGHLYLEKRDGTSIDVGAILTTLPDATNTSAGVVELATDSETQIGTDDARAVTPFGLASRISSDTARGMVELATNAEVITGTDTVRAVTPAGAANAYQPKDSDLTAIAALTGTNDNVIQRKSGAWSERTMAQLATDLAGTGEFLNAWVHNGTTYVDIENVNVWVGPTDPGSGVAAGTIWFDTTGV